MCDKGFNADMIDFGLISVLGTLAVTNGAPQSRVFFDPPEHLLTSFRTMLRVRFGGHLPPSPSLDPLPPTPWPCGPQAFSVYFPL